MKSKDKKNISYHLNEYDFKKLKLKFLDKDEIKIFSSLCQDGIFSKDEIIYNKIDKVLIATFSRFCWELVEKKIKGVNEIVPVNIQTEPHPGFPTDLQAQFMSLMCIANGKSVIEENIFENRFMHVPELSKMRASIKIDGNKAIVDGLKQLQAASVKATDLRASMSLIAASLNANGESVVNDLSHLKRGYENFEEKLFNIGAHIR